MEHKLWDLFFAGCRATGSEVFGVAVLQQNDHEQRRLFETSASRAHCLRASGGTRDVAAELVSVGRSDKMFSMTALCGRSVLPAIGATVCISLFASGFTPHDESARCDELPKSPPLGVAPISAVSLPNAYRLHERVISGGQPNGEAGFEALQRLGVKTVISVDGAAPNVTLAQKYGLRYVHLPHGYDGISAQRSLELAKAVSELPGPVYIHCHHGKHRSPVAATVACIGAGLMPREAGVEFLELAGTSTAYQGLYEVVRTTHYNDQLASFEAEFQESVKVPPLATAMVQIERTFDNLKRIESADWRTPARSPDLAPAHEALLLREHFAELLRTDDVRRRPAEFREILKHSQVEAGNLERQLRATTEPRTAVAKRRISSSFSAVGNDCKRCHRAYRD